MQPIGTFHCEARYAYDAPRQPGQVGSGYVLLEPHRNFEQALQDLAGFSRIWLIFAFHHNENWKPLVSPPRAGRKVGVFASRAPYRPNPIGLSCVTLLGVEGLRVDVGPHDLLDGTPILDIKPYIAYADSFPDASSGWLEEIDATRWDVRFSPDVGRQLDWLEANGAGCMRAFLVQQLSEQPLDCERKRIRPVKDGGWEIAYRTWRARYAADEAGLQVKIEAIYSGYDVADLEDPADPYGDKVLHRGFKAHASQG